MDTDQGEGHHWGFCTGSPSVDSLIWVFGPTSALASRLSVLMEIKCII